MFSHTAGRWQQTAELTASDGQSSDWFGDAVALSGATIVAGAPYHTVGTNSQQGAVYAFTDNAGTWQESAELTAGDGAAHDWFGQSVAVWGATIAVGSPFHTVGGVQKGAVYVFTDTLGAWQQTAELAAADGTGDDRLGSSLAMSGNTIAAGAYFHDVGTNADQGAVYVFSDSLGTWQQTAELTAGDGAADDVLGSSVAISGDTIVAGASSHAVDANTDQGAVYAFSQISGSWQQTAELTADDGAASDEFGSSVAVGPSTIIAGAPQHAVGANTDQGAAYAFDPVVATDAPAVSAPPAISGAAVQGQTLNETPGSWTNAPTSYSYQWEDCDASGEYCSPIVGATAQTYTPAASDVGQTIVVQETAANAAGSGSPAASAPTAVVAGPVADGAPVESSPPSISGAAIEGQTLTEMPASWTNSPTSYGYQWEDCDSSGSACSPIAGATGQMYTLTASDVGETIVVQETASNAAGTGNPAVSDATAVVAQAAPVNTSPPSISGTFREGATLTESHGAWTDSPTSYSYQWEDCNSTGGGCAPIAGATGQSYTLTASDVGETIVVQETATNGTGAGDPAASAPTAVISGTGPVSPPVNTAPPSISGTPVEGTVLTESNGSWTNGPTSYTYAWEDCNSTGGGCSPIAGATGQSYTLTASDVGATIVVQETASNTAGAGNPALSAATALVTSSDPASAPVNLGPPTISGVAAAGQTLTESAGSWTNGPTSFSYQWEDCDTSGNGCTPIAGATGQSYTLTASDVGATIVVQETASNAAGAGDPAPSAATAVVTSSVPVGVPVSLVPPTISGVAAAGQTLTESRGSWTNSPTSYAEQWEDCNASGGACTPIAGATGPSYTLTASDVGATIVVQETASNATGDGNPALSAATAVVAPWPPVSTSPPVISGIPAQGDRLSESHGLWTNSPTAYAYRWEDCNASGGGCTPIAGATGQSYTVTAADVGHTIVVQETASNAAGAGNPALSAATALVAGPVPVVISPPLISGTPAEGQTLKEMPASWTNSPTSFSYQWEDCDPSGNGCSPIAGATGRSYTLTAADLSQTIVVQETASNAAGAGSPAQSAATDVVAEPVGAVNTVPTVTTVPPANTAPPAILGATGEGLELTEAHGSWTNGPTAYTYQWEDCDASGNGCSPIAGATDQSYTLTATDVGRTLVVQETASNAAGAGSPAQSAATAVVTGLPSVHSARLVTKVVSTTVVGARAVLTVECLGATGQRCTGSLALIASVKAHARAATGDSTATPASTHVTVGMASFTVAAGKRASVPVALNAAGRGLLASTYRLSTAVAVNGATDQATVAFSYARIRSRVTYFYLYTKYTALFHQSFTTIFKLTVSSLPAAAHVMLICHGGGCPFTHHPLTTGKQRAATLTTPLATSHLAPRATLEIVVSAPNSIAKVLIITIRGGKPPTHVERCLPPGGNEPVRCAA